MRTVRTLIWLAAAAACAGEELLLEAPGTSTQLGPGGVVTVSGSGFAARRGDWLLSGESVRWDRSNNLLWASGSIVFVIPSAGVRIHASRIGLHPDPSPQARFGDAWEVEAWLSRGDRQMRIRAARLELHDDRLTFHDVEADLGRGGAVVLHCPALHAYLRPQERADKDKEQPARYLEGVAAVRPWVSIAGVPALWLPYLYRDYILDYPWSTFEAGSSRRLGAWARYRVGSNLREIAGWRTRLVARVDRYSRAGNGYGLEAYWRNRTLGHGSLTWYRMPSERVADPVDGSWSGDRRSADALDIEHYASGRGWAAAARWTRVPDADPSAALPAGRPPGDRFRADYLREDLENKPFARRGLATAWTTPVAGFVADTERRPVGAVAGTERIAGVEGELNRVALLGPLALAGDARSERLEREEWNPITETLTPSAATRTSWDGHLAASQWFGGLGLDGEAGLRGVAWANGSIGATAQDRQRSLEVPYADASLRLRLAATWGEVVHTLTPRLGLEAAGAARGSGNPGYDFADGIDHPDADHRYLVTGIETAIHGPARSFTGTLTARWGLRYADTRATEVDGEARQSSGRLVDLQFTASGKPHPNIELHADGDWDFRLGRWTGFDATAAWRIQGGPLSAKYQGTYIPPTATTADAWQNRPGLSLQLARYRLIGWIDLRGSDGGMPVDLWHAGLVRRGVDGLFSLSYEAARDQPGGGTDHRVAFGFSVGGDGDDDRSGFDRSLGGL